MTISRPFFGQLLVDVGEALAKVGIFVDDRDFFGPSVDCPVYDVLSNETVRRLSAEQIL